MFSVLTHLPSCPSVRYFAMIPADMPGAAATLAREAEARVDDGDLTAAVRLLEQAFAQACQLESSLPAWLVGRLAATYRILHRYEDEVRLLERYQATETSGVGPMRFVARLSKARALAARVSTHPNGATASVGRLVSRTRGFPADRSAHDASTPEGGERSE